MSPESVVRILCEEADAQMEEARRCRAMGLKDQVVALSTVALAFQSLAERIQAEAAAEERRDAAGRKG